MQWVNSSTVYNICIYQLTYVYLNLMKRSNAYYMIRSDNLIADICDEEYDDAGATQ